MATQLLDNFTGSGALRDHISDSGAGWNAASWQADNLLLDGAGRLSFTLDEQTATFRSQATITQVDLSMELVLDVGPITQSATQYRSDSMTIDLWDWYDYTVEISNGAGAADIGDMPTLYLTHRGNVHSVNVTASSVHTVRWDITIATSTVEIYLDGVLVVTSTGQLRRDAPDLWVGGYFTRDRAAGLPSVPTMLRLGSFHVYDGTLDVVPPFWDAFQKSHEVP